ncbi:hypothetical protein AGMMS49982_10880 [Bacteroidia bacterium]|nr:hypothetical protein AGMMS49982_10880 [Bacteroidia bacterium]
MNTVAQSKQLTPEDLVPGGVNNPQFVPKADIPDEWKGEKLSRKTDLSPEQMEQEKAILDAVNIEKNPHIRYGEVVHREEFGIDKGVFRSPKGNYIAFYRMDETMVGDYPLVDISARESQLKNIKYPMAGMTSHEVTLGIYSLATKKTLYLKTGEGYRHCGLDPQSPAIDDHYLTNISWEPSEKHIYIAELNRAQNHLQWNKYDIATGEKVQTLFEEKNDRYVEPQTPLLFVGGWQVKTAMTKPGQFIVQSRRDGYNHLYLYNMNGELLKQLTAGNWDVKEVVGLSQDEKSLFYVSNELNPIEFQAFKLDLTTGKKTQMTTAPGVHKVALSATGKYLVDKYSNQQTPLNVDVISTANGKSERLQTVENPYEKVGYTLPEITLGTLQAADGHTDLYYRLTKPQNFDPAKKYPVIIYVYGGPHSQMVTNNWLGGARGWDIYMAQKGCVVFTLDNRGTSNRGFEFESIIYRQLGKHEEADQMCGVNFLKSLPYVDADRIGVFGWSYGGFMTANLMLRHPDVFKVGVAGGPVIDWKYYEIMYGERYMDTPEENPEGYNYANMNNLAGNLKGHLLIIHGDEDPTVVWQHSLSFLKACITARTYPDYFVYPGHVHNVHGVDRVHLYEKITRYFEDFLVYNRQNSPKRGL